MTIKQFDKQSLPERDWTPSSRRAPSIFINTKGTAKLSKALVEALNLDTDHTLTLVQDEDSPTDWFLRFNNPDGLDLRHSERHPEILQFNGHTTIARLMFKSLNIEVRTASFPVLFDNPVELDNPDGEGEPCILYPILTLKPRLGKK
jgi:hypothetical protein